MFYNYATLGCLIRVTDCSIRASRFLNVESAITYLVPGADPGGGGSKGSMEPPFERASITRDTLIEQSQYS